MKEAQREGGCGAEQFAAYSYARIHTWAEQTGLEGARQAPGTGTTLQCGCRGGGGGGGAWLGGGGRGGGGTWARPLCRRLGGKGSVV